MSVIFFLLLPALLSLLLLCAHLLREGMLVVIPLLFLMLPLLLVHRGWVARLWQLLLLGAAVEWVRTGVFLALERQAHGEAWIRMALILGGVALFNVVAAVLFESDTLQAVYPRRPLY